MAADLANAALYLAEGDYKNAAISGLAMLPVVGTGAAVLRKACKMGCDKAVKGVSELADDAARQVSKRADSLPCNSFVPTTTVLMADGTHKAIEQVSVGDFVWAEDPVTGESGGREVVQTITGSGVKTLVEIDTGSGSVVATEGHPIWINNEGEWLEAGDVRAGDLLLDSNGVTVAVEQVTSTTVTETTVHNLTVADLHTYYALAGDRNVLTHNNNSSGCAKSAKEMAEELSAQIGKNSVSFTTPTKTGHIDLVGRSHYDKATRTDIDTPHVQTRDFNIGPKGKITAPRKTEVIVRATKNDIRLARDLAKRQGLL